MSKRGSEILIPNVLGCSIVARVNGLALPVASLPAAESLWIKVSCIHIRPAVQAQTAKKAAFDASEFLHARPFPKKLHLTRCHRSVNWRLPWVLWLRRRMVAVLEAVWSQTAGWECKKYSSDSAHKIPSHWQLPGTTQYDWYHFRSSTKVLKRGGRNLGSRRVTLNLCKPVECAHACAHCVLQA